MRSWIIGWHLASQPHNRKEFRCLSGDEPEDAVAFLVQETRRKHPDENAIVIRWCERKPEPEVRERTCPYCRCTRTEEVDNGPFEPAGFFDKDSHLWRTVSLCQSAEALLAVVPA